MFNNTPRTSKDHFGPDDILWPKQQYKIIAGSNAGLYILGISTPSHKPLLMIFNTNHWIITVRVFNYIFHI